MMDDSVGVRSFLRISQIIHILSQMKNQKHFALVLPMTKFSLCYNFMLSKLKRNIDGFRL